jgi:polyphenol oxidase
MTLPTLPESFQWTSESWGAALRCRPLAAIAPHLFTTRQLDLSTSAGYTDLGRAIGAEYVLSMTQVHGATAYVVRRGAGLPSSPPAADVVVSNAPKVAVTVRAADCVPILMADRRSGVVAAVHAGWRGTMARAAVTAVNAMHRQFGTEAGDIVAAIGPSIGPCCYEVGSELVDAFAAAGHERYLIDRWFSTLPPPRGSPDRSPLRLNVAAANRDQLVLAGVPEGQIHDVGLCTAMHLDLLTSYRVEKENAGRIAGAIRCM